MSVIVIGSTKGGVGKTTIAVNLAVGLTLRGRDVLLIDADKQGTALAFTSIRADRHPELERPVAVQIMGEPVRNQVNKLRAKYQDIVIDCAGHESVALRAALTVSNLVIIPTAPRNFDLWGVGDTAAIVRDAQVINPALAAFALLNAAESSGQDNEAATEALSEVEGIQLLNGIRLGRRKAFYESSADGLSVLEYANPRNPDGAQKAKDEFIAFLNYIAGEESK